MDRLRLREEILDLARRELRLAGPLPDGELAEVLDSMQRLALVVAIEDAYQICLDPEDEAGVRTIDEVVALVAAKVEARGEGAGAP